MQIPYFAHWHPTLSLRYLPMIKYFKKSDSLLEVGSGTLGIGPYIRTQFTGVDIEFKGPLWPQMKRVKYSGTNLPFKNNSFDTVINSDMLEHLPGGERQNSITEMMRVAKNTLIIGVPVGEKAHLQDVALDKLYQRVHGHRHQFLIEQTEFGLPSETQIRQAIKKAAEKNQKSYTLKIIPNMNLALRMWLMRGWISKNTLVNIFFRKILLLAIPLMLLLNHSPVYRKIFIVKITNQ